MADWMLMVLLRQEEGLVRCERNSGSKNPFNRTDSSDIPVVSWWPSSYVSYLRFVLLRLWGLRIAIGKDRPGEDVRTAWWWGRPESWNSRFSMASRPSAWVCGLFGSDMGGGLRVSHGRPDDQCHHPG